MNYSEKLKDPRWQKKRLEVLQRDNFTCQLCLDATTTLHVHHFCYDVSGDPWAVDNSALRTYCNSCHKLVESLGRDDIPWLVNKIYEGDGLFAIVLIYDVCGVRKLGIFRHYVTLDILEHIISIKETTFKAFGGMFDLATMNKKLHMEVT
jgi:hypothetical protein